MAFRRACSYQATITPPEDPSTYSDGLVTFKQDYVSINKNLADLTVSGSDFIVKLTQEETALFESGRKVFLQIRLYASTYNAPGSAAWALDVLPALNDQILGGP